MQKTLGILKLDTQFPRIKGDVGCADTWDFPVRYRIVHGGTAERAVRRRGDNLLPALIDGAQQLIADGADGIVTTCGFLCIHQQALAAALPVPVMTSALMSGRRLQDDLPEGTLLGILTASPADLSAPHLAAANIDAARAVIGGAPVDSVFAHTFVEDSAGVVEVDAITVELRQAAANLCARANVGSLLLECANMPPYAAAVAAETGMPVYSAVDAFTDFYRQLD